MAGSYNEIRIAVWYSHKRGASWCWVTVAFVCYSCQAFLNLFNSKESSYTVLIRILLPGQRRQYFVDKFLIEEWLHAVPLCQTKGSSQFNALVLLGTLRGSCKFGEWSSLYIGRVGHSVNWPLYCLYRRHRLAVLKQMLIARASSHLIRCHSSIQTFHILWYVAPQVQLVCPMYALGQCARNSANNMQCLVLWDWSFKCIEVSALSLPLMYPSFMVVIPIGLG